MEVIWKDDFKEGSKSAKSRADGAGCGPPFFCHLNSCDSNSKMDRMAKYGNGNGFLSDY